jgi:hypothetical protein
MSAIISNFLKVLPLFVWFILGGLGGLWLTRALFRLRPNEELLVGLSIGLISETWLVNLLGRVLPMLIACWAAVLIVLVSGLMLSFPRSIKQVKELFRFQVDVWVWIIAVILVLVFFGIGTGMGLYDEYPVLPLISQMAAGDMPPHFALDPKVIYNYHYFPYLFSAQLMRLGNLFPWTALDLQRGIFLTLSLMLLGLWVYRITRNKFAGIAAGVFSLFAGGSRWLLLLIPSGVLDFIDKYVERMGSGLNSGATMQAALTNPWAAQGTGPYTIPFAYGNGFNPATTIGLGTTNLPLLFLAIFLLTMNRWKNWKAI